MNDRHPAGDSFPADPGVEYSYAAYGTANYEHSAYGSYGTADDATAATTATGDDGWSTGAYAASTTATSYGGYDTGMYDAGRYDTSTYDSSTYETASYDTTAYSTGSYDTTAYGTGTFDGHAYGTGAYETTGWAGDGTADYQSSGLIPQQPGPHQREQDWPTPAGGTPQWDVNAFEATGWDGSTYGHGYDDGGYAAQTYGSDTYGTDVYGAHAFEAPAFEHDALDAYGANTHPAEPFTGDPYTADPYATGSCDVDAYAVDAYETDPYEEPTFTLDSEAEPEPEATAAPQGRGRRRSPKPRRSALLTVAAPSVAVLGVAGIAAASVFPTGDEESAQAAPDTTEVKVSPANSKLDTQLAGLREAGDDFADRASRTQERIDLKKRQEAERRRKAAEAARREALRPKFVLPVQGAGISAYFGQAGINWMSVHTGLDFPVSYGTPIKAATDGMVRTQWNPSYGNMIIVTAADGTETWYCHLSSTRIRSGSVEAGTVIGYSGNSGNSTGPHLHFEVRPGGGSAIDPLAWFRSHGLEPS